MRLDVFLKLACLSLSLKRWTLIRTRHSIKSSIWQGPSLSTFSTAALTFKLSMLAKAMPNPKRGPP